MPASTHQMLALWAVIPAALGALCCAPGRRAGRRRPDSLTLTAMGVMVLGMADTMLLDRLLGGHLLPATAWAAILVAQAVTLLVTRRDTPLTGERAAHLGMMALLTAATAGHGTGMAGTSMPGMHTGPLAVTALLLAAAYAVAAGGAAALSRNLRLSAERVAGAVSAVAMAGMLIPL